jgi:hypothetical protein
MAEFYQKGAEENYLKKSLIQQYWQTHSNKDKILFHFELTLWLWKLAALFLCTGRKTISGPGNTDQSRVERSKIWWAGRILVPASAAPSQPHLGTSACVQPNLRHTHASKGTKTASLTHQRADGSNQLGKPYPPVPFQAIIFSPPFHLHPIMRIKQVSPVLIISVNVPLFLTFLSPTPPPLPHRDVP